MDIKRGLRIPILGLGCGGAGATTIERETVARTVERAGDLAGRPVEA